MKSSGLAYSFISSRGEQAMRDKQLHASPRLFPLPRLSRNFFSFAPHPKSKVRAISAIVKIRGFRRRLLSVEPTEVK
jgi:hypothetical protein